MHNQPPAKVGDVVKRCRVGIKWGRCNTAEHVPPDKEYTVTQVLIHRFHTEIWLEGLDGSYNSADFAAIRSGGGIDIQLENLTPENLRRFNHGDPEDN